MKKKLPPNTKNLPVDLFSLLLQFEKGTDSKASCLFKLGLERKSWADIWCLVAGFLVAR